MKNENDNCDTDSEQRQVMHFCSDHKASMASETRDSLLKKLMKVEADCRVLVLRLAGENPETFAPETQEVMSRWIPKVIEDCMESDNV